MADELIPALNAFYATAEIKTKSTFLSQRKMLKLFTEEQEINHWKKKQAGEMNAYLSDTIIQIDDPVKSEGSFILQAGNIDTAIFLDAINQLLITEEFFLEGKFDYSQLKFENDRAIYKDNAANKLIFCEGHLISENPFFNFVKMKPAKGDVLTIKCEKLAIDYILNKGFFIMPLGNNLFKVGATYDWEDLTDIPSDKGREELISKLTKLLPYPFEIIKHEAGVRPAVIDRRPVLGRHPQYPQLAVFNGFGTKGVMLAPYFAKIMADYLENKSELNREIDCIRFYNI